MDLNVILSVCIHPKIKYINSKPVFYYFDYSNITLIFAVFSYTNYLDLSYIEIRINVKECFFVLQIEICQDDKVPSKSTTL